MGRWPTWGGRRCPRDQRRRSERRRDQRGSVLVLVPAGFLVLLLLGGISVDSAAALLGQHRLADITVDAANDAATEGLSDSSFYGSGAVTLDPAAVVRVVCADVGADSGGGLHDVHLAVAVAGATVAVRASAQVDAVFGRNVAHFATRQVSAAASATAEEHAGAVGSNPTAYVPITC